MVETNNSTEVMPDTAGSNTLSFSDKSSFGVVRTDDSLDSANLSDVEREVTEAEHFKIYGKASVEQYDNDSTSQKITMEAFENAIDQFFAQGGVISYAHKDVKVGHALRSYTLDSPATITIDGEKHSFEAGDTLKTEVKDDSVYLVAHIYGKQDDACSDASLMTRLKAFAGELNGFSVTIKTKEYETTEKGQLVTDIDWHSTTVGRDDQIKNPGSEFGVAEYKLFDKYRIDVDTMTNKLMNVLFSKSGDALTEDVLAHALANKQDFPTAAKEVSDSEDEDVEALTEKARSKFEDLESKADDREDLVAMVADMTDLSREEVNEALDEMLDEPDSDEMEEDVEQEGDYEDDEDEEDMEDGKADEMDKHVEAIADAMDVPVSQVMEVLSAVGSDEEEVDGEKSEATEADEADTEEKSEEDESADGSVEAETESKEADESEEDDTLTEEQVEAIVGEKLDGIENRVAEQVSENIMGKLETGSTPEGDENPATEDTKNLLDTW